QTIEEMSSELTTRGLSNTTFTILPSPAAEGTSAGSPAILTDAQLADLLKVLSDLEGALLILERRGLNLPHFLAMNGPNGLPTHRVLRGGREHWSRSRDEVTQSLRQEQERLGRELVVADEIPAQTNGNGNGEPHPTYSEQELHEVHAVKRGLDKLREFGLGAADLVPA